MGKIVAKSLIAHLFDLKYEMDTTERLLSDLELKKKALQMQIDDIIIEIKHETR